MNESSIEYLRKWNETKTPRCIFGFVIVLISGLITFINIKADYSLVMIDLAFLGAFVMNGIGWHLLSSIILTKTGSRSKKK